MASSGGQDHSNGGSQDHSNGESHGGSRAESRAEIQSGDRVRLCQSPPYLKTADPMPMLRSAADLPVGSVGVVRDRRPGGVWAVRFDQGAYLLGATYLEPLPQPPPQRET
jgi:hypothetical protein